MIGRFPALAAGVAVGAVAGVTLAFVHADRVTVVGVAVPFGVPLAVISLVLAQAWVARVCQRRTAAVGVALGWLAATAVMSSPNSSGDVPIPATTRAVVYLAAAAMALTAGVLVPVLRRPGHHRAQPLPAD